MTTINATNNFTADASNIIDNGNFDRWERNTSFTWSAFTVTADRWAYDQDAGGGTLPTTILSRQTLTAGEIANSYYFYRINVNGAGTSLGALSYGILFQAIWQGVRKYAGSGKKITFVLKARSDILGKKVGMELLQNYGSGGSPSATEQIVGNNWTLTSNMQDCTVTFDTNTLTGKTFGSNNDDCLTLYIWTMWGSSHASRVGAVSAETYRGSGNVEIAQVRAYVGDFVPVFVPKPLDVEREACDAHFQKSYNEASVVGASTVVNSIGGVTIDNTAGGICIQTVRYPKKMIITPTVTIYGATSGTANRISDGTADRAIGAGSFVVNTGESGFNQNFTLTAPASGERYFHWTAATGY